MTNLVSMLDITSDSIRNIVGSKTNKASAATASDSSNFDGIYNAAVGMITSTNNYLQEAQSAEAAYATGEMTSAHELAVIEQKANLSLQYTVAVKNALLSAYKEIMNIQL